MFVFFYSNSFSKTFLYVLLQLKIDIFNFSDQRCDGFPECPDETDEKYCQENIAIFDESYKKNMVFTMDKAKKMNCLLNLTILDVISIDDNNNMFKPKFEISVKWLDQRLKFQHLKKGLQNRKLLPKDELEQIWNPFIILDDNNQNNRSILSYELNRNIYFMNIDSGMFSVQRKFLFLFNLPLNIYQWTKLNCGT